MHTQVSGRNFPSPIRFLRLVEGRSRRQVENERLKSLIAHWDCESNGGDGNSKICDDLLEQDSARGTRLRVAD